MTYSHSMNMQQPKPASKILVIVKKGTENKTEGFTCQYMVSWYIHILTAVSSSGFHTAPRI